MQSELLQHELAREDLGRLRRGMSHELSRVLYLLHVLQRLRVEDLYNG